MGYSGLADCKYLQPEFSNSEVVSLSIIVEIVLFFPNVRFVIADLQFSHSEQEVLLQICTGIYMRYYVLLFLGRDFAFKCPRLSLRGSQDFGAVQHRC